jgi:enterochelin esterase family protein
MPKKGGKPQPYAPLRVKRGEKSIDVLGLTTDKDGRIYAATEIGVQVFDPTGRLCGVMTTPKGKAEWFVFEGDTLTLWIGETKYARKLRTAGVK